MRAFEGEKRKQGAGRVTLVLVCRKWSKFMEVSGRKRNSQDDTLPRSKINTETDTPEQKAWNVQPHWLAKCSDSLRSRDGVLDRCLRWSVHVTTGRVLSPAIIISQILQIDLIYLTLGQIHATCNNNVT